MLVGGLTAWFAKAWSLVVNAKGFTEGGPWGDILTLAAQQRGIVGLVIDGAVRDVDPIIELGFPVYARAISIKATFKDQGGRVGNEIVCGGQVIRTGDVIVGDRDGLVGLRQDIEAVIAAGEVREDKERRIRERILAGETTVEILQLGPSLERVGLRQAIACAKQRRRSNKRNEMRTV